MVVPKQAVVANPEKFEMPAQRDMRYQWIEVRMSGIEAGEMRDLITDAWRMCAPRPVARAYDESARRA